MQDDIRRLEDKIDALTKIVLDKVKTPSVIKTANQSDSTVELSKALCIAQKSYKPITTLNENTYSQIAYASLQQVREATYEALCDNGLSVIQIPFDHVVDSIQIIHTQLRHSSGEWVESQMIVKANSNDPAALTSYINWLKRTAYSAIVGYPIPKEDDDCVKYSQKATGVKLRGSAANKKDESYDLISKTQYDEIIIELEGYPDLAQMVLDQLEIEDFHEIRKSQFPTAIKGIREEKFKMKIR